MKRSCSVICCFLVLGVGSVWAQTGEPRQSVRPLVPVGEGILRLDLQYRQQGKGLGIRLDDEVKAIPEGVRDELMAKIKAACGGYFTNVREEADFDKSRDWWRIADEASRSRDERIGLVALIRLYAGERQKQCRIAYFSREMPFPPVEEKLDAPFSPRAVAELFARTYPLLVTFRQSRDRGKLTTSNAPGEEAGMSHGVREGDQFVPVDRVLMFYRPDLGGVRAIEAGVSTTVAECFGGFSAQEECLYIRRSRDLARDRLRIKCEAPIGQEQRDFREAAFLSVKAYLGLYYVEKNGKPIQQDGNLVGAIPSEGRARMCQGVTDEGGQCELCLPVHFPFVLAVEEFSPIGSTIGEGKWFVPWLTRGPRVYQFLGGTGAEFLLQQEGKKVECTFTVHGAVGRIWYLYVDQSQMGEWASESSGKVDLTTGKHEYYIKPNKPEFLPVPYRREPEGKERYPLPFSYGRRSRPIRVTPGPNGMFHEETRLWRDLAGDLYNSLKSGDPKSFRLGTDDGGGVALEINFASGTPKRLEIDKDHPQLLELALLLTWDSYAMHGSPWRKGSLGIDSRIKLLECARQPSADQIWDAALGVTLYGLQSERARESIAESIKARKLGKDKLANAIRDFEVADRTLQEHVGYVPPRRKTDRDWLALRYQTFRVFALHSLRYFESLLLLARDCIRGDAKYEPGDPLARRLRALLPPQANGRDSFSATGIVGIADPLERAKALSLQRKKMFQGFVEDEFPKPNEVEAPRSGDERKMADAARKRLQGVMGELREINAMYDRLAAQHKQWLTALDDWKTRTGGLRAPVAEPERPAPQGPPGVGRVREPVDQDRVKSKSKARRRPKQPVIE